MHGPLRHWCQCKGERFVRVEGGPGECQWVIAWTSSEDLGKKRRRCVWMRRLIIAFGCKRKDGCQCDGRMSYPHRGTKKAVHLKAMLALPFKFECPPRRMPHSEEPFSLHFPHFPGWTTKTIFVPFWFGHDLDNESRDGSAPQLLVSSHRDPL